MGNETHRPIRLDIAHVYGIFHRTQTTGGVSAGGILAVQEAMSSKFVAQDISD